MDRNPAALSRVSCALAIVAILVAAPLLGAIAWSRSAALMVAPTLPPDAVVLALLALGGAVASGYLAAGILLDLARCIGRWANTGIGARPVRRSQGRLPIAKRLVAGALGVGLLSAVALPAHATGEWDPGWQALAPAVVATEPTVPTPAASASGTPVATPAASATAAPAFASAPPGNAAEATPRQAEVVVRAGDSLWRIAAQHLDPLASPAEIAAAWPGWYAANRDVVGPDPGLIHPGQVLSRPEADSVAR
jgi:hypothetical protein